MSFKTAPNYLSGVSVFYGDDITKREIDGELVFFVGPSTKGPKTPVDLRQIDNLVPIFGNNNPLAKAAFEFWDGYIDSKQVVSLRPIGLRVGGISASVKFSFGITITTEDAYDGIENELFVYIDDTDTASKNVKVWDKNKLLVFDLVKGINVGYVRVEGTLTGSTNKIYGQDLTGNPTLAGTTLASIALEDYNTTPVTGTNLTSLVTNLTVTGDIQQFPPTGSIVIKDGTKTQYSTYTIPDYSINVLNIPGGLTAMTSFNVYNVISVLVKGDSQLNLSNRELFEKFTLALREIETFTPDYLVPGGVTFDAKDTYVKQSTLSTELTAAVTNASAYVYVSAAAQWPASGNFTIPTTGDALSYSARSAQNGAYALKLEAPVFKVGSATASGDVKITLAKSSSTGDDLSKLLTGGNVKIGSDYYKYNSVTISQDGLSADIHLATPLTKVHAQNLQVTKVPLASDVNNIATVTFSESVPFECGIGYVKEEADNEKILFSWSDEKYVPILDNLGATVGHDTYNLAHFGYLFAKFCNDAAVGYNTPLCGMNTSVPTDVNSKAAISAWVGTLPSFIVQAGIQDNIVAIGANGSGLLGDSVLVGSLNFNRCGFTSAADNKFADPAYGMLLTDEGFVDGGVLTDSYGKVVDLGKFMCVGAGLLTFSNRGKATSYVDTMGAYALGQLSGMPKNEGISFSRIGSRSNVSITTIINRKIYNDLVRAGYVVTTREKGLGWVINNDNSAVRRDSGYFLLSTTRLIKDVVERKRGILVSFIGKPMNRFYLEAAKTKIAESYAQDITMGFLNGFTFQLDQVAAATAIGKLLLKTSLNPPLELVQVDIDAVIDRNVTNQG